MKLEDITPEDLCREISPLTWDYATPQDRERWLQQAERHLDAVRRLVEQDGPR